MPDRLSDDVIDSFYKGLSFLNVQIPLLNHLSSPRHEITLDSFPDLRRNNIESLFTQASFDRFRVLNFIVQLGCRLFMLSAMVCDSLDNLVCQSNRFVDFCSGFLVSALADPILE